MAPGEKVVSILTIVKQSSNTHEYKHAKIAMTLGGSSCGQDLFPHDFILHKGYMIGSVNFMSLNTESKRSALARNALCKQLSSLHIATF